MERHSLMIESIQIVPPCGDNVLNDFQYQKADGQTCLKERKEKCKKERTKERKKERPNEKKKEKKKKKTGRIKEKR